jgi:alkanesulfonate monooxygenase SsuD/methylene tetrahydromethanopterin reductase-like flavin-dependent oxidoreductase (luciferase family)
MTAEKLTGTGLALAGSTLQGTSGRAIRVPLAFNDLAEAVSLAEETGYGGVWVPDHGVWEPFGLLAAMAHRTEGILLAPGVVTIASRPAAAMVAAALTLDRVSNGRAILGLGGGGEQRVDLVASYVEEVHHDLHGEVPVYLAALGPRMAEAAGKVADGVLLNWCTPARVERAREELARITIAVYVRACLGHDEEHAYRSLAWSEAPPAVVPRHENRKHGGNEEANPKNFPHRRELPPHPETHIPQSPLCIKKRIIRFYSFSVLLQSKSVYIAHINRFNPPSSVSPHSPGAARVDHRRNQARCGPGSETCRSRVLQHAGHDRTIHRPEAESR